MSPVQKLTNPTTGKEASVVSHDDTLDKSFEEIAEFAKAFTPEEFVYADRAGGWESREHYVHLHTLAGRSIDAAYVDWLLHEVRNTLWAAGVNGLTALLAGNPILYDIVHAPEFQTLMHQRTEVLDVLDMIKAANADEVNHCDPIDDHYCVVCGYIIAPDEPVIYLGNHRYQHVHTP